MSDTTVARGQPAGRRGAQQICNTNAGCSVSPTIAQSVDTGARFYYTDGRDPCLIVESMALAFGSTFTWTIFGSLIITRLATGSYRVQADYSYHSNPVYTLSLARLPIVVVDVTIAAGTLANILYLVSIPETIATMSVLIRIVENGASYYVDEYWQSMYTPSPGYFTGGDSAAIYRQHHQAGI